MVFATNLGFPRIGANRELKRLVENFWNKKVDEKALLTGAKVRVECKFRSWILSCFWLALDLCTSHPTHPGDVAI